MTREYFQSLREQGYARIPVRRKLWGALDTPLAVYLKLTAAKRARSFLLESVTGGERVGRYSFIGLSAPVWLEVRDGQAYLCREGGRETLPGADPLSAIETWREQQRVYAEPVSALAPRFGGGLAGYFGYDTARWIEPKLGACPLPDPLGMPDIFLLACDELAVTDHLTGEVTLITHADCAAPNAWERAQQRLDAMAQALAQSAQWPQWPQSPAPMPSASSSPSARSSFTQSDFLAAVARAKEYIAAGDLMQVQIGQRLSLPFAAPALSLYRALRALNPSPYLYYFDFGAFQVAGASPEILLRQEASATGNKVTVRPLAGTRRRGNTPDEDVQLESELLADPKERAEHLMLIDLARNDIGRIAQVGSVKVTEAFVIERYSHVMHIVSNVEGQLRAGVKPLDALRAAFPAGTLTGAPKIRAMEIIDELEPVKRGFYGGACGFWGHGGAMDMAIAIRTGIVMGGTLHVQASAGIVADSDPLSEWRETEAKAAGMIAAAHRALSDP